MPALELFDRLYQRSFINLGVGRNFGVLRQVTKKAEPISQRRDSVVGFAWSDRFDRLFSRWDRNRWSIPLLCQFQVMLQGDFGAAIGRERRLNLLQRLRGF